MSKQICVECRKPYDVNRCFGRCPHKARPEWLCEDCVMAKRRSIWHPQGVSCPEAQR